MYMNMKQLRQTE